MIVKLAVLKAIERTTVKNVLQLMDDNKVVHVPRPADEQTGRKKAPIRIVQQ